MSIKTAKHAPPSSSQSIWDYCSIDVKTVECINTLDKKIQLQATVTGHSSTFTDTIAVNNIDSSTDVSNDDESKKINNLQSAIVFAENDCRIYIEELDSLVTMLDCILDAHTDITGRTNSLMYSCESLLEQQHNLYTTAESLKKILTPFDDIEDIASILGIPVDARGNSATNSNSSNGSNRESVTDPRSPEFQAALLRLSRALSFLYDHKDFLDSDRYQKWLLQLQNRATSLIAKAMKELLESSYNMCVDITRKQPNTNMVRNSKKNASSSNSINSSVTIDDKPLEAIPMYQKFRGLGFRMKELSALLLISNTTTAYCNNSSSSSNGARSNVTMDSISSDDKSDRPVVRAAVDILQDVKNSYIQIRANLLIPFLKQHTLISNSQSNNKVMLCTAVRHAYTTLLRITQLEYQLAETLFHSSQESFRYRQGQISSSSSSSSTSIVSSIASNGATSPTTTMTVNNSNDSKQQQSTNDNLEVKSIIEIVSNLINDHLRPLIIHEGDVDELCRVITTLSEDIKAQMVAMVLPKPLLAQILSGLELTVSDAQERLAYCAEIKLRQEVQLFEPLSVHLNYPDLLKATTVSASAAATVVDTADATATGTDGVTSDAEEKVVDDLVVADSGNSNSMNVEDVSRTWFPTLRCTLSLLSKLYGVVDMSIFEDYARRSVGLCVKTLKHASDTIKKKGSPSSIHADLFLIRHLLILRDQLIPFEIRLQGIEQQLDFKPTGAALSYLSTHTRSLLRFDTANGFLQFAWEGIPAIQEMQVDGKKELDNVLKNACFNLKISASKVLIGSIDGFLSKVIAFIGDIPTAGCSNSSNNNDMIGNANTDVPLLSSEAKSSLKNQSFMTVDRIKEVLDTTLATSMQATTDLVLYMKLYIDNNIARSILLKPIQQEVLVSQNKMLTVLHSCVDSGQSLRDLQALLAEIHTSITTIIINGSIV